MIRERRRRHQLACHTIDKGQRTQILQRHRLASIHPSFQISRIRHPFQKLFLLATTNAKNAGQERKSKPASGRTISNLLASPIRSPELTVAMLNKNNASLPIFCKSSSAPKIRFTRATGRPVVPGCRPSWGFFFVVVVVVVAPAGRPFFFDVGASVVGSWVVGSGEGGVGGRTSGTAVVRISASISMGVVMVEVMLSAVLGEEDHRRNTMKVKRHPFPPTRSIDAFLRNEC